MLKELLKVLCCPICKKDLIVKIDQENDKEILEGTLTCDSCQSYPIIDSIPHLLTNGDSLWWTTKIPPATYLGMTGRSLDVENLYVYRGEV